MLEAEINSFNRLKSSVIIHRYKSNKYSYCQIDEVRLPLPVTHYPLPSQEQINEYVISVNNMTIQPGLTLSEISANGFQVNNVFTEIFKQLRSIKTESDILQAGVEIVKQSINCDRTVVYSLQDDSYCKIVAEAVTPGYTETLGMTIKDTCFEKGYIEKYRKGRVRAITNIYKVGMSPCYLKDLEKIEVKSNLVVPIISDNSLYGLLVMHQCSRERQWQQTEVAFVLEVANWIIEQIKQQQAHLDRQSKLEQIEQAHQLISSITKEIHGATTVEKVMDLAVCRARQSLNCDRVVVYSLQKENLGEIVAEATSPALAPILGNVIKDPCFEYRYIDRYQQGRIRATANIFEANMGACYVETLAEIGVKSNLVAPINWDNGTIYGLLIAHQCFTFKDWHLEEVEHFRQIALHTGLCLSKAKIKEQSLAIETKFNRLANIKNTVNLAQQKIEGAKQPIYSTNQILIEANNLNKLLEREINKINETGFAQTKKDIKLIQIIFRKLVTILAKARPNLGSINACQNEAKVTLNNTIALLEEDKIDELETER